MKKAIKAAGLAASVILGITLGLNLERTVRASLFFAAVMTRQYDYIWDVSSAIWTGRDTVNEGIDHIHIAWFTPRGPLGSYRPAFHASRYDAEIVQVHYESGVENWYIVAFDESGRIVSVE